MSLGGRVGRPILAAAVLWAVFVARIKPALKQAAAKIGRPTRHKQEEAGTGEFP
jgi:hypothetical protein